MISPDVQSNADIWPSDPKVHRWDENRVKTQKTQDKIPGTPKVGRVETCLFYVAIGVSIDKK